MITYKCEHCGSFRREEGEKEETYILTRCRKCFDFKGKAPNEMFNKMMMTLVDPGLSDIARGEK